MFTLTNTGQAFAKFADSLAAARSVSGAQADITLEGDALGGFVSGSYPEGVKVRGADGQIASGQWGAGARLYATDSYLVEGRSSSQVLIEGITLHAQGDYAPSCVRTDHWYGADIHIKDCLIGHGSRISGSRYVFQMRNYGHRQRIYVENCVIHTSAALHGFDQPDSDVELVLKNCSLIDCNWRGRDAGAVNTSSSKLKLINCYIHSALGPCLEGLGFAELIHCATSDSTAYGVGAVQNVAPELIVQDRSAKDFRAAAFSPLATAGLGGEPIGARLGLPEANPVTTVAVPSLSNSGAVSLISASGAGSTSAPVSKLTQTSTLGSIAVQPTITSVWVPPMANISASGGIDASAAGSAVAHVAALINSAVPGAVLAKPSQAAAIAISPYTGSNAFGVISAKSGAKVAVSVPTVVNDSAILTISARASGIPSVTIPTMLNGLKVAAMSASGKVSATAVPPLSNASRLSGITASHSGSTTALLNTWYNASVLSSPKVTGGVANASVPAMASDTHLRPLAARNPQAKVVELAAYRLDIEHHSTQLYIEQQVTQLCVSA